MIPKSLMAAFQGVIPSVIATCSKSGVPNITVLSQVYFVDATHVALSRQFFSKTLKNLEENPVAVVQLLDPQTCELWVLDLRYETCHHDGPLFEQMEMQLEAIASAQGMQDVFKLRGADLFEVVSVRKVTEASP